MAPRPSSSGISISISTTSGAKARTFLSASMPSRAVATTRNSPDPSTTSVSRRRKNGLSSTTSTLRGSKVLDAMRHRAHLYATIADSQPDRTSEVSSYCFPHKGYTVGIQHLASSNQVTLSHLNRAGWRKCGKHAGAAREAGGDSLRLRAFRHHQLDEAGNRCLRELGDVAVQPTQSGSRQEYMRHPSHPCFCIVEHDGNAAAQAHSDQGVVLQAASQVGNLHHQLPSAHGFRR